MQHIPRHAAAVRRPECDMRIDPDATFMLTPLARELLAETGDEAGPSDPSETEPMA